jgi:polar amino acid transport system substrate-binding protein
MVNYSSIINRTISLCTITVISLLLNSTVVAGEKILYLNNTNKPPYTTEKMDGYIDIILEEVSRRLGIKIKLLVQPPERGLKNANTGQIDGDLTRIKGIDKTYQNLVRVPETLLDWEFAAFSKNKSHLQSWEKIYSHPVAYIRGWKIYENLLKGANHITATTNEEQLFKLLRLGRVDTILYEKWQGLMILKKMELQDTVKVKLLDSREMYIYLHKRNSEYVQKIATILKNMKSEGLYEYAHKRSLAPFLTKKDHE